MAKAILELEMPSKCETCPIKKPLFAFCGLIEYICGITGERITDEGRRSDCPLKLADDVEVLRKVKDFLDRIYPADVFTGESGDEGVLMIVELRKAIDKVLGGKEDV